MMRCTHLHSYSVGRAILWGNKHEYWMWSSSDLLGVYNRAWVCCSFFCVLRFNSFLEYIECAIPIWIFAGISLSFSSCKFELNETGTKQTLLMSLFSYLLLAQSQSNFKQTIESNTNTEERRKKVKEKNKTSSCLFIFSKNFALQRRYGEFTGSVEMNTQRN